MNRKIIFILVGPTASGKTSVSIELAKKIDAEIISADSRQIYRNISIVAAVPPLEERKGISHHLLETLELEEEYSAGKFELDASKIAKDIFASGKNVIVTGGSGLYIKALVYGIFQGETKDLKIRDELNLMLLEKGKEYLYEELKKVDPESASKMSPEFHRRVLRALEVYYTTGKRISSLRANIPEREFDFIQFGLLIDRPLLYKRINNRVDEMIDKGLIDEVKKLRGKYDYKKINSLNTVGIKEVYKYLEGEYDYETAIKMLKQNTRRYAKRQMTWFRKDKRIHWIKEEETDSAAEIAGNIYKQINDKI